MRILEDNIPRLRRDVQHQNEYPISYRSGGTKISVTFNSSQYHFPKFSVLGTDEYSSSEILDSVKAGDCLSIGYIIDHDENIIVQANNGETKIRSLDGYNTWLHQQQVLGWIAFSFAQVIFLFVLVLYVVWNSAILKIFKRNSEHR